MYGCFARLKIVAEITGPYSSLRKRVIGWNVLAGLKQLKIAKRKVELKKEKKHENVKLEGEDIPQKPEECTVEKLQRLLLCRGTKTTGKKNAAGYVLYFIKCQTRGVHSMLHSLFQCRHATLLQTNGCWVSNQISFPAVHQLEFSSHFLEGVRATVTPSIIALPLSVIHVWMTEQSKLSRENKRSTGVVLS